MPAIRAAIAAWKLGATPQPISSRLPAAVAASFKAPTSGGSTGRPKLIVATQPAVWEALADYTTLLRMAPDGVHLVTGPLYHNGPFTSSALALLKGNTSW